MPKFAVTRKGVLGVFYESPQGVRDPRRIKCPDCPDGQLWDRKGPTDDACPTCGGDAFKNRSDRNTNQP